MLVALAPSPDQIRYYAVSAMNGFETLDAETAIANAKDDLSGLLRYLDALAAADNSVPIFGCRVIDGEARLERIGSNAQLDDPADLKVVRATA